MRSVSGIEHDMGSCMCVHPYRKARAQHVRQTVKGRTVIVSIPKKRSSMTFVGGNGSSRCVTTLKKWKPLTEGGSECSTQFIVCMLRVTDDVYNVDYESIVRGQ